MPKLPHGRRLGTSRSAICPSASRRHSAGPATLDGKPIFLHIWASWCPPCIAELPDIQRLVQSVSPEEVAFLLVSVDKNLHQAQQFLQKNQVYPTGLPLHEELPDGIQYNVIPTTYIIAPSGKIIYKHEGLAQYNHEDFKQFLLRVAD